MDIRNLRRVYQRHDGSLLTTKPVWNDRATPFCEYALTLKRLLIEAPENTRIQNEAAEFRAFWSKSYAPFDPLTVTEKEFYDWAASFPEGKWHPGLAVKFGDIYVIGLHRYQAASSGLTGAAKPIHTNGTVSDGGIDWTHLESYSLIGDFDEKTFPDSNYFSQWRWNGMAIIIDPILKEKEDWKQIREKRNIILKNSDVFMTRALEEENNVIEWKTYRTALRNIPQNYTETKDVVWPSEPK